MKMILAALALIATSVVVSTTAQALPAVGDTATFTGTTVQQGHQIAFQVVTTLTQFDAAQNQYMQTTTTSAPGMQPNIEQKWMPATSIVTNEKVAYLLANCAAQNGVLESVTVSAGAFNTCRITDQQGSQYNIGPVPFGIVKGNQPASQTSFALVSFSVGH
jgi:hypothetical protein